MRRTLALVLAAGVAVFHPETATGTQWDTYTCKNGIVSRSDTMVEVLKKCGNPSFIAKRDEVVYRGRYPVTVTVEEWTYNEGPYAFMYLLRFEGGRVTLIESLEPGF